MFKFDLDHLFQDLSILGPFIYCKDDFSEDQTEITTVLTFQIVT